MSNRNFYSVEKPREQQYVDIIFFLKGIRINRIIMHSKWYLTAQKSCSLAICYSIQNKQMIIQMNSRLRVV